MKPFTAASAIALACCCSSITTTTNAFVAVVPLHHTTTDDGASSLTSLEASRRESLATVTGAMAGWLLGPHLANAAGAYQPEEGYDDLDMSMPSYNVAEDVDRGVSSPMTDPEKAKEE